MEIFSVLFSLGKPCEGRNKRGLREKKATVEADFHLESGSSGITGSDVATRGSEPDFTRA